MDVLGCQRILWAVHTDLTNSTEVRPVKRGIGQKGPGAGDEGTDAFLSQSSSVTKSS